MRKSIQALDSFNEPLSPRLLRNVLGVDVFFAIPRSLVCWLYKFDLPLSQQYIAERIIAKAIQRPANRKKLRVLFSYSSLAKEVNGCDRKTVISIVSKLIEYGVLKVVRVSSLGTLYDVNISQNEIVGHITYRRQTSKSSSSNTPSTNPQYPSQTSNIDPSESENSSTHSINPDSSHIQQKTKDIESKILSQQEKLMVIKKEYDRLQSKYLKLCPIGQKISIHRKQSPEEIELCGEIMRLSESISAIESSIKHLQKEREVIKRSELPSRKSHQQGSKSTNIQPKTSRFIREEDVKGLKTRLDKLKINGHLLHKQTKEKILNEIVWAMRFGYLSQKEGSNYYLINLALKLVKDNVWRTPIGFEINQIERFTRWVLNGGKKKVA